MLMQREVSFHEGPPHDFVERIVSPHILPKTYEGPTFIKQPGGVAPTGLLKYLLLGLHQIGEAQQEISLYAQRCKILDFRPKAIIDLEGLNGSFSTDPTTRGGIKISLHRAGVHLNPGL